MKQNAFDEILANILTRPNPILIALKHIGVEPGTQISQEAKAHHEAGHVLVGVALGRKLKGGVRP